MIREDYVNEEIMKLLLEKDYWQDCDAYYIPTQSQVMKWLREVHNIFIQVELYSKYNDYCFELFQNTHRLILKQHETYNSYEEAVEAALEYTLKKLL